MHTIYKNPNKQNHDDIEDDFINSQSSLGYFVKTNIQNQFTVDIDEQFFPPQYYRNIVQMLTDATEDDVVVFRMNSTGGRLDGLLALLEGIRTTDALTVAVIIGECSSAASMLTLHCDQVYVGENATMMSHQVSFGTSGKGSDVLAHVQHTTSSASKLLRKTYKYFLNEKEIEDMLNGKEIYMEAEEIIERLQKREELKQAEIESEIEAEKQQQLLVEEPKPKRKGK